jgi:hypothetical protein
MSIFSCWIASPAESSGQDFLSRLAPPAHGHTVRSESLPLVPRCRSFFSWPIVLLASTALQFFSAAVEIPREQSTRDHLLVIRLLRQLKAWVPTPGAPERPALFARGVCLSLLVLFLLLCFARSPYHLPPLLAWSLPLICESPSRRPCLESDLHRLPFSACQFACLC